MIAYLLERLFYGLSILLGVLTLVFFIFNAKPSDPARMLGGQFADEQTLDNIRKDLGLDKSLGARYFLYLNDVSPLSLYSKSFLKRETKIKYVALYKGTENFLVLKWPYLRRSYQSKEVVSTILANNIPGTALLAFSAILFAIFVGIGLGVISALHQNKFTDQLILFISVLGMSAPSFFVAIIVSWLGGFVWSQSFNLPLWPFAIAVFWLLASSWNMLSSKQFKLDRFLQNLIGSLVFGAISSYLLSLFNLNQIQIHLPGTGLPMTGSMYSVDPFEGKVLDIKNLILPALTLGVRPLAVVVQLTRASLLEVLELDYIRTAKAKGLPQWKIIYRHALKNALNPVVTAISGWFASLLAGAVFIEYIFGWKGLGLVVFQALEKDDLPVVTGAVLFFASVFVLINILVDIIYAWLDPRVRMAR